MVTSWGRAFGAVSAALALALASSGCGLLAGLEDHRLAPDSSPPAATGPVVLAENQPRAHAVQVDDESVYWIADVVGAPGVQKTLKEGGAAVELVAPFAGPGGTADDLATHLALDADNVYWTHLKSDSICTIGIESIAVQAVLVRRKDASSPPAEVETLCSSASLGGIVLDDEYIFVTETDRIGRLDKNTREVKESASGTDIGASLAIDPTDVYFITREGADESSLRRTSKDLQDEDAPLCSFAEQDRIPSALAVDETRLYWIDHDKVMAIAKDAVDGVPDELVAGEGTLFAMVLDGDYIYWTNAEKGTIHRAPKDGAEHPVEELASGQGIPSAIAVDDAAIYWTNFGSGTVMKMSKP